MPSRIQLDDFILEAICGPIREKFIDAKYAPTSDKEPALYGFGFRSPTGKLVHVVYEGVVKHYWGRVEKGEMLNVTDIKEMPERMKLVVDLGISRDDLKRINGVKAVKGTRHSSPGGKLYRHHNELKYPRAWEIEIENYEVLPNVLTDIDNAVLSPVIKTKEEIMALGTGEEIELMEKAEQEERAEIDDEDGFAENEPGFRPNMATTRKSEIEARRRQREFRNNVKAFEDRCRITGLTVATHARNLIAGHIKPWKNSNDNERVDGNNGLFLAPHADHLFDRGFITFENDGKVRVSSPDTDAILMAWNIDIVAINLTAAPFRPEQQKYLEWHRNRVFDRKFRGILP